jgi:hemolysin D
MNVDFTAGEVIFAEGSPRNGRWLVSFGRVRLSKAGMALATLSEGAELGEEGEGAWETSATALTAVTLTQGGAPPAKLPAVVRNAVAKVVAALPARHDDLLEFQPDLVELEERPAPKAAEWVLRLIVALMVFAVTWASLAEIDRVVTAEGRLVTTAAKVVVQPLETGVVRSIRVRVGQTVHRGDVLASLDATFTEADTTAARTALTSLDAQIARLEAELSGERPERFSAVASEEALQSDLYGQKKAEVAANLASLDGEIGSIAAELDTGRRERIDAEKTLVIARELEQMRVTLMEKNAGSHLQLLEAQTRRATAERDVNRLGNSAHQLEQKLAALKQKRTAYTNESRGKASQELQTTRRERDKLAEDLKKQERRSSLVTLTAPTDAVVLEVAPRSVGSVASQAEPLVTLVPLDTPLEAEVEVQPQDIALLRGGDSARVKLEALPYQRYGILEGRLDVVSADVLKAEKNAAGQQASIYRARIVIANQSLRNVPADFRLIPGMTVTAEIRIGRRRVISYFAYPLLRALDESFREP